MKRQDAVLVFLHRYQYICNACRIIDIYGISRDIKPHCPISAIYARCSDYGGISFDNTKHRIIATLDRCSGKQCNICNRNCDDCRVNYIITNIRNIQGEYTWIKNVKKP